MNKDTGITVVEIHPEIIVSFDNSKLTKEEIEILVEEFKKVVNDFFRRKQNEK